MGKRSSRSSSPPQPKQHPIEKAEKGGVNAQVSELSKKLNQNLYGSKDEIKNLSLMKKLDPSNRELGIGVTIVEGSSSFPMGLNSNLFSMISDSSKIKRKLPLPKDSNFNYSGLLIGPKGYSQKQLE